ncbi:MCE family protein [Pseudonocardiaceae bacterium YIM PH 21723]|nr:MCE family protein [Pseudonocardiaceae bacterium YIM PH 21723]
MRPRTWALIVVLVLVFANAFWLTAIGSRDKHITAYFDRAVGVFAGSDVRVLGVKVGRVDEVSPQGTQVRVELTVDHDVQIPASAGAVSVAPSVVSDRYVQLVPAYTDGAELETGATIPRERTATPVELDQLYSSLNDLVTALGPNGANKDGALSRLLTVGADNLRGNGAELNTLVAELGKAAKTLSGSSGDLFGTIDYLRKFTGMLAQNDGAVRQVTTQLADVSRVLSENRGELAAGLNKLATALDELRQFIADNRAAIKSNVDKLASVTQSLVDQRASLAEALDAGPLAVDNLLRSYNPQTGTLDGRSPLPDLPLPLPLGGGAFR